MTATILFTSAIIRREFLQYFQYLKQPLSEVYGTGATSRVPYKACQRIASFSRSQRAGLPYRQTPARVGHERATPYAVPVLPNPRPPSLAVVVDFVPINSPWQ